MNNLELRNLNLKDPDQFEQWSAFLRSLGIGNFSSVETDPLDGTIGLFENNQLIATGSYAGNILKYIAVCNKSSNNGALFNRVISELLNILAQKDIFHVLVFTKPKYCKSFEQVGFSLIVKSDDAAFLETGDQSITSYLADLPKFKDTEKIGAIVMNANPFTNGHRYLIEQAAKNSDHVYVFVVSTDKSLFTTKERTEMIKAGTKDLDNVVVVPGGDYLVSYATFPAYFLSYENDKIVYQTTIDALVFKQWIAKQLSISTRYLGTEPESRTTKIYNEVLEEILPPDVQVNVIPRLCDDNNGEIVSARTVRLAIANDEIAKIKALVPPTTYDFIIKNKQVLQDRIKKGMKISGN
ncbi:[Citrate [pro-3S]-lyase] ligase [Fructilactobacillus sanfranciscensis]|uniref:[citrate (pro-3S)-lyase] ligase n=1 Tax=Fructilactobacillus sanfranciscensis TaxID=1625 RepID=UPI00384E19CF